MDAAEKYFADKGYRSTSMEDIAGDVGIRPSAIYKHFRNKQDLYEAVLDRIIQPFFAMAKTIDVSKEPIEFSSTVFQYHIENPILAQLAIHATLTGGEHRRLLVERWYKPYWEMVSRNAKDSGLLTDSELERHHSHFIMFNNMMLGYVTLAPLHSDGLEADTHSQESIQDAADIMQMFGTSLMKLQPSHAAAMA